MQIQEIPGIPDPAKRSDEFAIDRETVTAVMFEGATAFFDQNPAFNDLRDPVAVALNRMVARRVLRRAGSGDLSADPGCPRCRQTSLYNFARSVAQRFQIKFMAAWTDPVRRPPMVNALTAFFLTRNPEIDEKGLDLVVNVHKLDGTRMRCVLYSPKGNV
jgi:hypothetical protein